MLTHVLHKRWSAFKALVQIKHLSLGTACLAMSHPIYVRHIVLMHIGEIIEVTILLRSLEKFGVNNRCFLRYLGQEFWVYILHICVILSLWLERRGNLFWLESIPVDCSEERVFFNFLGTCLSTSNPILRLKRKKCTQINNLEFVITIIRLSYLHFSWGFSWENLELLWRMTWGLGYLCRGFHSFTLRRIAPFQS